MSIKNILGVLMSCVFLSSVLLLGISCNYCVKSTEECNTVEIVDSVSVEKYPILHATPVNEEQENIRNEIFYGEVELLAVLVYAEAGIEDELGQRYVADVVLNRVESDIFPDTIEEVIYQKHPIQFSTTRGNTLITAGYSIKEETFKIVMEEVVGPRKNTDILYFRTDKYGSGTPAFKHGHHYFSTK